MPKRYAVLDKTGNVINTIIWDGVTPLGNSIVDTEQKIIPITEVIFVEDPYASPNDKVIDGMIYRPVHPTHEISIDKAVKFTEDGKIKKVTVEDLDAI